VYLAPPQTRYGPKTLSPTELHIDTSEAVLGSSPGPVPHEITPTTELEFSEAEEDGMLSSFAAARKFRWWPYSVLA
jgi:hypothetical protein